MPVIKLDLSDAVSLQPIPEGTYSAEVQSVEGPNSGAKSTYMTSVLRINDGGDYDGRTLYYNWPITGKGAGIGARFISLCTGEEIDVDDLAEYELDTDDLIGAELRIVVGQREYPEGSSEMRNEINKILPAEKKKRGK